MAGHIESTDILMVGKTGTGKSALGNAILQKKAFKSKNSTESVTKTADFDYCQFDGRILKVVDGPGLGDTKLEPREAVKLVVDAMSKAILTNTEGYHAILLVVRYGVRFTKEDSETVATLKKIFGEKFITDHAILVMTCGDSFESDAEETGQTFEEWCDKQRGDFGQLYTDVQKRAILFDNTTKEKDIMYDQVRRLLDMVDALGARYTCEMFKEAKHTRYRLLQGARRLVNEEAIREAGVIAQLLGRVDYAKPAEGLCQLQDLHERASLLLEDVLKQDQGTNTLKVAMKMAQNLKATTAEQLKEMQRIFEDIQQDEFEQSGRSKHKCEETLTKTKIPSGMMEQIQQEEPGEDAAEYEKAVVEYQRRRLMMRQIQQEDFDSECEEILAEDASRIKITNAEIETFQATEAKKYEQGGRLEAGSLAEDSDDGSGRTERSSSVSIRQAEIETFQAMQQKFGTLRGDKERIIRELREAEDRERQREENKKRRAEEEREEERARKKDQMDKKKRQQAKGKLAEEKKKAIEDFKIAMARLAVAREKDLQEKLARLEEDYQELKEESRLAWLKGAPAIVSKIFSGFGAFGRSRQK